MLSVSQGSCQMLLLPPGGCLTCREMAAEGALGTASCTCGWQPLALTPTDLLLAQLFSLCPRAEGEQRAVKMRQAGPGVLRARGGSFGTLEVCQACRPLACDLQVPELRSTLPAVVNI